MKHGSGVSMEKSCPSETSNDPTSDQLSTEKKVKVAPSNSKLCEPRQSFHELTVPKLSQASKKAGFKQRADRTSLPRTYPVTPP